MVCYRRDDKSYRPTNKKNRRHLSGQSRGNHQDQVQVNRRNDTTYTSDHDGGIPRPTASSAPAPAPRMRFGAAHNPGEYALARQPGTFRNGTRQLEGGTAPPTTLSGGTSFGFRRCPCSVASLSSNAAQIASVKSPRAPTLSADDSHGVVPAAGTSASSVVCSSQVLCFLSFCFDRENARFQRRSPRSWFEFSDRNRASSAVSVNRGISSATGVRAPNSAPINHGTGACALRGPHQARVAQIFSCSDGASPFCANVFTPPTP